MKKASKKKNLTFDLAKPKKSAAAVKSTADMAAFVAGKDVKRLSLDIPMELHTRLKLHCAATHQKMTDFLIAVIEKNLKDA